MCVRVCVRVWGEGGKEKRKISPGFCWCEDPAKNHRNYIITLAGEKKIAKIPELYIFAK